MTDRGIWRNQKDNSVAQLRLPTGGRSFAREEEDLGQDEGGGGQAVDRKGDEGVALQETEEVLDGEVAGDHRGQEAHHRGQQGQLTAGCFP